jgi:hypothetical protein
MLRVPAMRASILRSPLLAAASTLLLASTALASPRTFKDGPYPSTGPDSGNCGDWATDTYNRIFTVSLTTNQDGAYNVVEKYASGHFLTIDGRSPGACDDSDGVVNPLGLIKGGVSGTFSGTLNIVVTGTFDPNGSCGDPCTTDGWVAGFFGATATYETLAFSFTYKAQRQGLIYHQWTNSSAGNSGDIASS